jgi:uncharacterized protein YwgA/O-acetyl-ADP-ribose deacetylase (regulator of RNase III)
MVNIRVGNLFESEAQAWVNTVNCVGIMGKGIALEFKQRFPEMFLDYAARCKRGEVKLGEPYVYHVQSQAGNMLAPKPEQPRGPKVIVNFPTKDHWRSVSRLKDIIAGLEYLENHYRQWGITSLAVPPLGSGQGQLEWRVVGPTLYRHLKRLDIPVELYAPHNTPVEELTTKFLAGERASEASATGATSRINPAWVALVSIVARIKEQPYHWRIGRTTFQKIAFFATALGLPTGLQYRRASYGPFSEGLKPLIAKLENNGILVEHQEGQMFTVEPGRTYEDSVRVFARQLQQWEPIIERVTDLFLRMQTKDAEIAATVFFVGRELAERGGQPSEMDVLDEVKRWKQKRRPPLEDHEIAWTIRKLNILDWMNAKPSPELPLPDDHLEYA